MMPDKRTCGKQRGMSKRQFNPPDHIPGFKPSKYGNLRFGMALLLTALLVVSIWPAPAVADNQLPVDCINCHGTFADVHGSVTHQATPGSGQVVLFADNDHDDAGWTGTPPYFAVTVDCTTCHNTYLPAIHSNQCSTCHPTPYDTLAACSQAGWNGGCQQGGCHTTFHEDAIKAHKPFAVPDDSVNDCSRCHDPATWDVLQTNCLNCHAAPATGYLNPPVTTSNAQPLYNGAAEIEFSIKENGKVGIGRTFYTLDGGETASGSEVVVSAAGSHTLEFWSVDQFGTQETSTNQISFSIVDDSTPPMTTSDVQSTYYQGALIHLTATDDSSLGVKNTYYTVNGGFTQTGTNVTIPGTTGTFTYRLVFWSVDWSGNIEDQHTVTFTVISGNGTIKLVWWDCDLYPSQAPAGSDKATWVIRNGGPTGHVVASGSGLGSSGWSGVNTYAVPISPTPYYVHIDWDSVDDAGVEEFPNNYVTTPGQLIRISY